MAEPVHLSVFPAPLHWLAPPRRFAVRTANALSITAGERTDLFRDPRGAEPAANAPALVGGTGDTGFTLSARVRADLSTTFDAAVLLLFTDAATWAKLCLELSPQGRPTLVSVVTRGTSDDCNSFAVPDAEVRLRVSRLGSAFAFHARLGEDPFWHLIRYFALDGDPRIGFSAQSPAGAGLTADFEEIDYVPAAPADLRTGV